VELSSGSIAPIQEEERTILLLQKAGAGWGLLPLVRRAFPGQMVSIRWQDAGDLEKIVDEELDQDFVPRIVVVAISGEMLMAASSFLRARFPGAELVFVADASQVPALRQALKEANLPGDWRMVSGRELEGTVKDLLRKRRAPPPFTELDGWLNAEQRVTRLLVEADSLDEIGEEILGAIAQFAEAEVGELWIRGEGCLQCIASWHKPEDPPLERFTAAARQLRSGPGDCLQGRAWTRRSIILIPELERDRGFLRRQSARVAGLQSGIVVPIMSGSEFFGVLLFFSRAPRDLDKGLRHLLRSISESLALFLSRVQAEQALRGSERIFRLFLERTANYAIFHINADGKIDNWNSGAERMFGYSEEEVTGQSFELIFTPQDRAEGIPRKEMEVALKKGEAPDERWHQRKNGQRFWVSGYLISLRDESGRFRGFAKIMQDLTERKTAEEEVRIINARLEERVRDRTTELDDTNQQMQTFVYSVAHDLRAPLRAMQGFAEALLEDYASRVDEQGQDYLRRISDSAARLDALMEDLLAYSRLSQSRLSFAPVNLEEAVQNALVHLQEEITAKGAVIRVQPSLPMVSGHLATIEMALINLLSNALKFTHAGVSPRITITSQLRGEMARTVVSDNGIGIPEQHQDKIFGVFQRLHTQQDYPGTGIGLAIVQAAITRMKGRVGVNSALGQGSTFWFDLPRTESG
jgi:PAS domain S-box-containing protein